MSRTRKSRHLFRLLLTFALFAAGCGDAGTAPEPELITPGRLDAVAISPQATVGATISPPPSVVLRDTKGRPMAGVSVSFAVTAGGGNVERQTSLTGPDGTASAGSWVLGTRPGPNTLEARSPGVAPVTFEVGASVGPAASLSAGTAGPAQGVVGRPVEPSPAVVVRDACGNAVAGATVTFAPATGSGELAQPSAVTDTSGSARVAWTLGPGAGTQSLQAALGTLTLTLTADAVAAAPAAVQALSAAEQAGTVGQPVAVPPAVQVKDGFGNPVGGAAVQFVVTEGAGQVTGGAATTDATGTARVGGWTLGSRVGANRLTATVAGVATVSFSVAAGPGPAATLARVAGDGQTVVVGTTLPVAPAVTVSDAYGNPVPNAEVTFSAASGVVTGGSARTDTVGVARVGSWRLGNTPGVHTLEARAGTLVISFTATASPGAPTVLEVVAGQSQSAPAGTAVTVRPAVRVRDAAGNDLGGIQVTFSVTSGGGTVSGAVAVTDSGGIATVGGWTLGQAAGSNKLTAAVTGAGSVSITATGLAGPAARLLKAAGDNQIAMAGTAVPIRPTVKVTDGYGNPVWGVSVSFAASPGSTVTGATQVTGAAGTASVNGWVLADSAGGNTLTASAPGLASVTFHATGVADLSPEDPFRIEIRYLTAVSEDQRQAFDAAAERWQEVITAGLPNGLLDVGAGQCGTGSPAVNELIDDLVVFIRLEAIDGPGATLGSAGPCYVRGSSSLPLLGSMRLDLADVEALEQSGRLGDVILHEFGHVLGIGTVWDLTGTIEGEGTADPFFNGSDARQSFLLAGGTSPAGYGVPVENSGGAGTRDSHWRESVLGTELMTGWISGSSNPLSAITIASLGDLGYAVDPSRADPFTVPAASGYRLDVPLIELIEQPLPRPRRVW